ncbi:MAG: cytidylate kinase family protein [Deltaproteobacteria bacterium]|nr:cytidylate kinase family protein [Deltaproteobacteria bacterium]
MAIITISRGTFSGGMAVAEKLSAKLGYPCISKEVVLDAVEEFGVPEEKLIAAMEKPPKSWLQSPERRITHLNYVRYALLKRARKDDLVYHGYAGHLLLGDIAHVIRVRVIADMEYRINAAIELENISRKEAISRIKKLDKQSLNWTRFLYGVDWEEPSLYDLVINIDRLSVEGAAEIIAQMVQLEDFRPDESSRRAFNNQVLSSMVWAALTKDERTNTSNLRVTADDGVVTISGNAGYESTLKAIEEVTMKVEGVKEFINEAGIYSDQQRL